MLGLVNGGVVSQESKETRDLFFGEFDVDRIHADKLRGPPLIPSDSADPARCHAAMISAADDAASASFPTRRNGHADSPCVLVASWPGEARGASEAAHRSLYTWSRPKLPRTAAERMLRSPTRTAMAPPALNDPIDRSFDVASRIAEDACRAERQWQQQWKRLREAESAVEQQCRDQTRLFAEFERQTTDTLRLAETAAIAASNRIAEMGSAALMGFDADLRASERLADLPSVADLFAGVDKTVALAQSTLAATVRDVGIAQASSAALMGFGDQFRVTERFTDLPSVADLFGGVDKTVALDQAALAKSLSAAGELVTSLEPFKTLVDRPLRVPDWTRTHDATDLVQPPTADVEVEADTESAVDLVVVLALAVLVAMASMLYMVGAIRVDVGQAWEDAVLLMHLINVWEPHPAISGYVKLNGYLAAVFTTYVMLRYIRRRCW